MGVQPALYVRQMDVTTHTVTATVLTHLTFRRRIKSRLPFAGIIRRLPYSTRFQDMGQIEIV